MVLAPLTAVTWSIEVWAAASRLATIFSKPATSGLEAQMVGCDGAWLNAATPEITRNPTARMRNLDMRTSLEAGDRTVCETLQPSIRQLKIVLEGHGESQAGRPVFACPRR